MAKPLLLLPLLAAACFFFLLASASASAPPVPAAATYTPATPTHPGAAAGCYPRLFAFGDSLIDTGNFIHYSTAPGPVARSPYGETFFHRPTGRWSDGRLIVDFVVERLGFPYWTPYLAGKTKEDFRYGANFAVASGTALNQLLFRKKHLNVGGITPYSLGVQIGWFKKVLATLGSTEHVERLGFPYWTPYGANFAVASATALNQLFFRKKRLDVSGITPYSLGVQIGWFKKVLATLGSTEHERKEIMARSLFLVGEIGANDYNHPFFQNKTLDWVKPLVPQVIRSIGLSLETLIGLGAKTLYVPGVFPLGCVPRYLFLFRNSTSAAAGDLDPATGCLRWLNDLTSHHNNLLKAKLAELRRAHPGVSLVYVDYYGEVNDIVSAPTRTGFAPATVLDACCGGGGFHNANFTIHCTEPGAVQCTDPSKYVSWDGLHMTEAVYRIMARGILDGPFAMPPIMSRCKKY
ncbi:unnamed protein product [Urochloa decumbens]|uniref:GDSL esterase/lipase n=1 Tax=Urochloa decumbens TaxID=240449 RepID=A0ABC9F9Q6_9POAL